MSLVNLPLFDPEEDEDDQRLMRWRHIAISVHTARWNEFRDELGLALKTLDPRGLQAFFARHVEAVTAEENARREQVSGERLQAVLSTAPELAELYLGAASGKGVSEAERGVLAAVRTGLVPRLEQLSAGAAVVEVPRQGWLELERELANARRLRRLLHDAPPLIVEHRAASLARRFEQVWTNDVVFIEPGYRSAFDEDRPHLDAAEAVLEAADRCFELCVGDLPVNLGIGGAIGLLEDAQRFLANQAVASKQAGVHIDLSDVELLWEHLGFVSGAGLDRFITRLEQPVDLKAEWRRDEQALAQARAERFPDSDEAWVPPEDEVAWAEVRAENCGYPSFDLAQREFSSRVTRFLERCRDLQATGRTLLTWTDEGAS